MQWHVILLLQALPRPAVAAQVRGRISLKPKAPGFDARRLPGDLEQCGQPLRNLGRVRIERGFHCRPALG